MARDGRSRRLVPAASSEEIESFFTELSFNGPQQSFQPHLNQLTDIQTDDPAAVSSSKVYFELYRLADLLKNFLKQINSYLILQL